MAYLTGAEHSQIKEISPEMLASALQRLYEQSVANIIKNINTSSDTNNVTNVIVLLTTKIGKAQQKNNQVIAQELKYNAE